MQVVGALDQCVGRRGRGDRPAGAVPDVVDEVARAVGAIADEGAAGRAIRIDGDGRDVRPVAPQPLDVEAAEVVVADAADQAAGLAELGHLIDEDGGRSRGERADERDRLEKAVADFSGHDLDQDLADGNDLLHVAPRGATIVLDCQAG